MQITLKRFIVKIGEGYYRFTAWTSGGKNDDDFKNNILEEKAKKNTSEIVVGFETKTVTVSE